MKQVATEWTGQTLLPGAKPRARKSEPESSVLKRVMEALEACGGVMVMRNNVGGIRKGGRFLKWGLGTGSADIVCCVSPHGRWLCIETKRGDGGLVSDAQTKWLARMRECGAVCGVCTTPDEAMDLVALARRPKS